MAGFWTGKRVLITGHTGFKGSWLSLLLLLQGAEVTGFALAPNTQPNLFTQLGIQGDMRSVIGDVRDITALKTLMDACKPDAVFHLAAQPIVRESYRDPVGTYATNVMGTTHVLECVRTCESVKTFLNVTTDKVYRNNEWAWGYRENAALEGFDPYSTSKSCSELVTNSYRHSFFADGRVAISTARAGNVIGGGDYACDRIIPDCVRAAQAGKSIAVRNPAATRPYQHVLEPLNAYLAIASRQWADHTLAGAYNVGPDDCDCATTARLVDLFIESWGEGMRWENRAEPNALHEASFLKLDCSKMKAAFGWSPTWRLAQAVEASVDWTKAVMAGQNARVKTEQQIQAFLAQAAAKCAD